MDISQFSYFISIAEAGSLSQAAEKLYISQPGLSQYLTRLERSLGTLLFIREKNNTLTITEAGTCYLEFCRDVLKSYEQFRDAVRESSRKTDSVIRYGVLSEYSGANLNTVLPTLKELPPEVSVEVITRPRNELFDMLMHNEIDLIRASYLEKDPALCYRDIYERPMDLVVPQDHPLAKRGSAQADDSSAAVALSDLTEESFVLPNTNSIVRRAIDRYFGENHFRPKIFAEVASSPAALTIIESGVANAIGIQPRIFTGSRVKYLRLDPPVTYPIGLIYRRDHYLDPAQKTLMKLICEMKV